MSSHVKRTLETGKTNRKLINKEQIIKISLVIATIASAVLCTLI